MKVPSYEKAQEAIIFGGDSAAKCMVTAVLVLCIGYSTVSSFCYFFDDPPFNLALLSRRHHSSSNVDPALHGSSWPDYYYYTWVTTL
jgi:hypothetical protein